MVGTYSRCSSRKRWKRSLAARASTSSASSAIATSSAGTTKGEQSVAQLANEQIVDWPRMRAPALLRARRGAAIRDNRSKLGFLFLPHFLPQRPRCLATNGGAGIGEIGETP